MLPWIVDGGQPGEEETAAAAADEFDLKDIMSEEVTAPIISKEEQLQKVSHLFRKITQAWPATS